MPDEPTTPAIVPLSLLEALRNLDTPVDDGLDELAPEVVAKRLGLSPTVHAQIARYRQAAERGGDVSREEALSVFRLVGRRPDAALAFADAGRRAARYAAQEAGTALALQRMTPEAIARRIGASAATKVAREAFGAELAMRGDAPEARIGRALSVEALPDGAGCAFYDAVFGELLRLLAGLEGAMTHERCAGRGDDDCSWRWSAGEGYE